MPKRKVALCNGFFYHVFSKSIEKFEVFRFDSEYERMLAAIRFYRHERIGSDLAHFLRSPDEHRRDRPGVPFVSIVAYCVMPTHIHFLISQTEHEGITRFMHRILGSYAIFFNKRIKRKGPLWEGRFGARLITTDEDMLHMSRYIHLNPTSAGLVLRPEEWKFSSYHEYVGTCQKEGLCDYQKIISMSPTDYKKFAADRVDYQRSLQIIKAYLMD